MDDKYNCGDQTNEYENNREQVEIRMSEVYSISSLESGKIRDYLKSFSQTSVAIKDSLKCFYHTKSKFDKKQKIYRYKPYRRNQESDKFTDHRQLMQSPIHSQSHFTSLDQKIKEEMKNTDNSKSLKVKNPNGTTTEITLKPIVLMHVREIPAAPKVNNQEIYQLAPTTTLQSTCQINNDAKVLPENTEPNMRVECDNQNHSNTNVLRVKSSRNCTDLSSERKFSCMKMSKNIFVAPELFRRPSSQTGLCHNGRNCVKSKMSSMQFPTCPSVCYHDQSAIPGYNGCLEDFLDKLHNKKDIVGVSSYEYVKRDHPQANYSVTTFFRHPAPRPSSTSSGYIQGETRSPQQSDIDIK